MSVEERFLKSAEEDDEVELDTTDRHIKRHRRLEGKNRAISDSFLGDGPRINAVGIMPRYYGELLTWALHRHIEDDEWEIVQTLGYHSREPVYIDVNTDYNQRQNLLMDGQMLVRKGKSHFIITVDVNLKWRNSVQAEGHARRENELAEFVTRVMTIADEQNFYRGKKIEFAGRLRFLDLNGQSWESIVLDKEIKCEIKANTTEFLRCGKRWSKYGISPKRGVLLAGEPGTGKTIICKALMADAEGITCITTSAYALDDDDYVTELYELANDLSPCIVFIEDIDLIGQNREEFGYQKGSALLSLLAVMDGIEERKEIVTVATTNCFDTLDKALSQRPSRFDRVIKLCRPSLSERRELVSRLCQKIPLDESTQDYISHKSDGCTPAQLQEIVFSLAIEYAEEAPESGLHFCEDIINHIISRINGRNGHRIGFGVVGDHNGCNSDLIHTTKLI